MKKLLLLLIIPLFFSCNKKKEETSDSIIENVVESIPQVPYKVEDSKTLEKEEIYDLIMQSSYYGMGSSWCYPNCQNPSIVYVFSDKESNFSGLQEYRRTHLTQNKTIHERGRWYIDSIDIYLNPFHKGQKDRWATETYPTYDCAYAYSLACDTIHDAPSYNIQILHNSLLIKENSNIYTPQSYQDLLD